MVLEKSLLIILDRKPSICMAGKYKYTKHTRKISRRIKFVINGEEWNFHKTFWCEVFLKLVDIVTNHFRLDRLNPRLGYAMVILKNWQNTCQRGVTGYRKVWKTTCSEWLEFIEIMTRLNEF